METVLLTVVEADDKKINAVLIIFQWLNWKPAGRRFQVFFIFYTIGNYLERKHICITHKSNVSTLKTVHERKPIKYLSYKCILHIHFNQRQK